MRKARSLATWTVHAAEAGGALGDQVGVAVRLAGDLVEHLMDADEGRSPHVPVRLLQLAVQIDRRSQMPVQKLDGLGANVFG